MNRRQMLRALVGAPVALAAASAAPIAPAIGIAAAGEVVTARIGQLTINTIRIAAPPDPSIAREITETVRQELPAVIAASRVSQR